MEKIEAVCALKTHIYKTGQRTVTVQCKISLNIFINIRYLQPIHRKINSVLEQKKNGSIYPVWFMMKILNSYKMIYFKDEPDV